MIYIFGPLIIILIAGLIGLVSEIRKTAFIGTKPSISNHDKAMNFLSELKCGDRVTIFDNYLNATKKCYVKENMPSIKKIELQYQIVEWRDRIFDYADIEKGLLDLNNLNEITIESKEPFLK